MKKIILLLLILISWNTNSFGQICQNPNARLERLKYPNITKTLLYEKVREDLDFIKISPADVIADIGSYDGQYPCIYSIFTDSVIFYLNDVQPEGFKTLNDFKSICAKFKGNELTNTFKVMIGEENSTNLPSRIFDKVIMRDALHHCSQMNEILIDIKRIMKPNGKLFLFEQLKLPDIINENLCVGVMEKEELLNLLQRNGFVKKREKYVKNDLIWLEFELKQ